MHSTNKGDGKQLVLFPFSANPNMSEKDIQGLSIYNEYFESAFNETRIHNIVVSGDYGIGKSSVIRSFESSYCKKIDKKCFLKNLFFKFAILIKWFPKRGFLYISIGDYKTTSLNKFDTMPQQVINDDNDNEKNQQNVLERRLLLQIYSSFHKRDLPASSFRMIQEHGISRLLISIWCSIIALFFLLSFNSDKIINTIIDNSNDYSLVEYEAELRQGSQDEEYINSQIQLYQSKIDRKKSRYTYNLFYISSIVFLLSAGVSIYHIFPKLKARQISIKSNTFEATCEQEACESYIDQHTTEIVYCLEKIRYKIYHTVIIEDLDRVDYEYFYEILARLREINYLVNLRLSHIGSKEWIRFVYVINNEAMSRIQHSKFADVIIPIFPTLNANTCESVLERSISQINKMLKEYIGELYIAPSKTVQIIAPYIIDYRLQFAVLNEYGIMCKLYCKSNPHDSINQDTFESILAISTYKNIMPDDYNNIKNGRSCVIPVYKPDKINNEEVKGLLDNLAGGPNPLLNAECLFFVGFSKMDVIELYKEKLINSLDDTLSCASIEDELFIQALNYYCTDLCLAIIQAAEKNCINAELKSMVMTVIDYKINKELRGFDWLFNQQISADVVYDFLCSFNFDEEKLKKLYLFAGFDENGDESIFDRCKQMNDLNPTIMAFANRKYSQKQFDVIQLGLGCNYSEGSKVIVTVDGIDKSLSRQS